jgi:hypothetical protein
MLTQAQIQHAANRRRLLKAKSGQAGGFFGFSFTKAVVLLLVLGAGCIVGGLPELGLSVCSIGVMALFVRWLVRRGHLAVGLLLVAFLLSYLLTWCVGFLGYVYVLPWRGFGADVLGQHFVVTAILVFLAVCGTCLGGWAALHLVSPVRNNLLFRGFPREQLRSHLLVFGAVFLTYQILWFRIYGLNARWDIGSVVTVGSNAYWVAGFRSPMVAFFALLGLSLKRPWRSVSNLWVGIILLPFVVLNLLGGGRGYVVEAVVLCAMGALFSSIGWRALARLCVLTLPILVASMLVIGWARDSSAFAGGSVTGKIAAISQVVREGSADTSAYEDPYYLFFSRLFEPSGQVVIDDDTDDNTRLGWINFDRLPFLFVPQFLHPAKLPLTDGNERLVNFHGYQYSTFTASPLTFLADAYERFGIPGVIGFHFAAGMILVLVGRLVLMARWQLLGVLLLVSFAEGATGLNGCSVLEFVSAVFYGFLRNTVVITCIFAVGHYLQGGRPAKTLTKNKR